MIENKLRNYWNKKLNIDKANNYIIFRKDKRRITNNASKYGCVTIYIDNNVLYSLIQNLHKITKELVENNKEYAGYYIKGLFSGDGTISLNKFNYIDYIGICFNPHSKELSHYINLLKCIGINVNYNKNIKFESGEKAIKIYGIDNFLKILNITEFEPFLFHKKNSIKLYTGFLNGQKIKSFMRLKYFKDKNVTVKEFSKITNIHHRSSHDLLVRWAKRDYLDIVKVGKRSRNCPYIFTLGKRGKNILNSLMIVEEKYSSLLNRL